MIDLGGVVAVDGHDGSGKTTLSRRLAARLRVPVIRPFGGSFGRKLLQAAESRDFPGVVAIGAAAIHGAINDAGGIRPLILDRGWMTVASLVDWADFVRVWPLWMPSALCWADLDATLIRLSMRDEPDETIDSHRRYLGVYRAIAESTGSYVLRTDLHDEREAEGLLAAWFHGPPAAPRVPPQAPP